MAPRGPSHAEIWDDSTLVNSWNEALNEYKKYHSIAAKGEKVEIVVEEAAQAEANDELAQTDSAAPPPNSKAEKVIPAATPAHLATTNAPPPPHAMAGVMGMPQAVLNGVQDESLKNLMMSWYYAGYYTGVYEGKQQAFTASQQGE